MVLTIFSKNQYKNASNLRSILKPIYIILTILGLFPYSFKLRTNKNGFSIIQKSIYLNFLCAMFFVIIMCSVLVLHLRQIYYSIKDNAMTGGIMPQINYITELSTLLSFCFISYITVFLNRFRFVKILNMISSLIDAPNINSVEVLKRLWFQIKIVLVSLSFLLLLQMAVNLTRSDSILKILLVTFTFNLPQMIQFTIIAFFYLLMKMLVEIFRNIREHINDPHEKKDGITKVESKDGNLTFSQIELIYTEVLRIKENVNEVFEAPILATLIQCFHSIVSETHIIYHGVVLQRSLSTHDIINCSIWIIYQLLKIFAITSAGNSFTLEAHKLTRAINSFPTAKQDLRFFLEVQHLSALMSLPGNKLTVYGYFSLDATLMFKVIASATMYVIILVQFDKKS